jgi:hypothetical protein
LARKLDEKKIKMVRSGGTRGAGQFAVGHHGRAGKHSTGYPVSFRLVSGKAAKPVRAGKGENEKNGAEFSSAPPLGTTLSDGEV